MSTGATPGQLLHTAIEANDWLECKELLERHGSTAGSAKNFRGSTPLMLAADGKCGKCNSLLLQTLLIPGMGGSETAAERNRKGRTAADIAAARGQADVARHLRSLESNAASREAFRRCPHCCAKLRSRSKLAYLGDRVKRGEDHNSLVLDLFSTPEAVVGLDRVEFHRVNSCVNFRKELTESMALITELRRLRSQDEAARNDWSGFHIIDLCAGSSFTGALALHVLPGCFVTAVDIVAPDTLPHFDKAGFASQHEGNSTNRFSYIQGDVKNVELLGRLRDRINTAAASSLPPTVVVFAMHCCGDLSLCAVDIFFGLEAAAVLIMPCCLPSKNPNVGNTSPPMMTTTENGKKELAHVFSTGNQDEQYRRWSELLRRYALSSGGIDVTADVQVIPDVLSARRTLITVSRPAVKAMQASSI